MLHISGKKVSIEYCHIYPGKNEKEEILQANIWMPRVMEMFKDCDVQACMMIDDIHGTREIDDEYIQSVIDQLEVKPDCIYPESAFMFEANKMAESIDPKERDFITSNDRTWLRESVAKFRTSTEYLLSWKNKKGIVEYSCPALAATSYLVRLGALKGDGVPVVYGDDLMEADFALNILDSFYVQVEDKAQSIIEAVDKEALRKIGWFFF